MYKKVDYSAVFFARAWREDVNDFTTVVCHDCHTDSLEPLVFRVTPKERDAAFKVHDLEREGKMEEANAQWDVFVSMCAKRGHKDPNSICGLMVLDSSNNLRILEC